MLRFAVYKTGTIKEPYIIFYMLEGDGLNTMQGCLPTNSAEQSVLFLFFGGILRCGFTAEAQSKRVRGVFFISLSFFHRGRIEQETRNVERLLLRDSSVSCPLFNILLPQDASG
jgi:hypothetical protein